MIRRNNGINLLIKLSLVLIVLELYRILLLITNSKSFSDFGFYEHVIGIWFDAITIALYFLPFIILFLIPLGEKVEKIKSYILTFLFILTSALIFFFNAWDVAYFSYTEKRTSYDYLIYMLNNPETGSLAGEFLLEFWWLILFYIISLCGILFVYFKVKKPVSDPKSFGSWIGFLFGIFLSIVIGRGGFQLKPIG
ncbi:MAG: hypothetical protein ACOVNZ_11915, partial [Crocinitomicaceae bacterium]